MLTDSESALARAVLIHGPISRAALTRRLGLSPASLTRLAKPFLDQGIMIELDDVVDGLVGRPTRPLDIAPDSGRFVGIKMTGDRLYAVATDVRASVLSASERALPGTDPAVVADAIMETLDDLAEVDPAGLGISIGGSVRDGVVEQAAFLGWRDVDLRSELSRRLVMPVTIENDLGAKRRIATHAHHDMAPIRIEDLKVVMLDVRPGILAIDFKDLAFGTELDPPNRAGSSSDQHGEDALELRIFGQKGLGELAFVISGVAIDPGNVVLAAPSS